MLKLQALRADAEPRQFEPQTHMVLLHSDAMPQGSAAWLDAAGTERFAALKAEGRAAFVAYVMAGDPSREEALEILRGLPAAGADLIVMGSHGRGPIAASSARAAASHSSTCGLL